MKFAFFVLLVSCSSIKDVKGPDNTPHKSISCGYIDECFEKAADACVNYKMVRSSSESWETIYGNYETSYTILVKCIPPENVADQ